MVTIELAKKEGWYGKTGSKWQTMPQQMLMYRSASWLVRAYAPEIAMGLHTSDEIEDGIVYETTVDESGKFEVATSDIRPSSDYDDRQKTTRKPRQIKSPEAEAKSTTEPTKAPVADPALEIPAAYAEIADRINRADQECKINWALETAEIDIKDEAQLEELRNLAEFRRQQIRKAN